METPTISAKKRERMGTRYARRLRASGRVPGVLYGHRKDPISLSVDEKEMMTCLRQGSRLLTVDIEGQPETCLVKDFQFDHLGSDIIHIDFSRVNLTEEVEVIVSLQFTGDAVGLKTPGSIFRTVNDSVSIRCLAGSIPSELILDISELDAGSYLSADAIELPEGSALATDAKQVICRITVVKDTDDDEAAEGETATDGEAGEAAAADDSGGSNDDS